MKLNEIYYKVELKVDFESHIHIEKDLFNDTASAEKCFNERFTATECGYLQGRFNKYNLALAEIHPEEKRQIITKYRQAPI